MMPKRHMSIVSRKDVTIVRHIAMILTCIPLLPIILIGTLIFYLNEFVDKFYTPISKLQWKFVYWAEEKYVNFKGYDHAKESKKNHSSGS